MKWPYHLAIHGMRRRAMDVIAFSRRRGFDLLGRQVTRPQKSGRANQPFHTFHTVLHFGYPFLRCRFSAPVCWKSFANTVIFLRDLLGSLFAWPLDYSTHSVHSFSLARDARYCSSAISRHYLPKLSKFSW